MISATGFAAAGRSANAIIEAASAAALSSLSNLGASGEALFAAAGASGAFVLADADLARGAIAGAFIVAAAFLAGYAAIRRSGLAVCALLVVLGAGALQFSWLGFLPAASPQVLVLIQALFAAAAIVFLSGAIGAARYNHALGGLMFVAALVIAGMGLINFVDRIELAGLMRWSLIAVAAFAGVLTIAQSVRGDMGARLILPGVAMAALAPLAGPFGLGEAGEINIASHGLFALGVLTASIVALTESGAPLIQAAGGAAADNIAERAFHAQGQAFQAGDAARHAPQARFDERRRERDEIVLDSQLARVLDYAGVAIWDWSPAHADQTAALPGLLGADSSAPFTPDALRAFIHEDDAARFEADVAAAVDGPFDVTLKLFDGRRVRMRGARAADEESESLERMVAFIEAAPDAQSSGAGLAGNGVDGDAVRRATEAAIVPAAADPMAAKLSAALEKGDIVAAFQPIVALADRRVAGYEALARWRDQEDGADEGPETFVRAAEKAGKGDALARAMLDQAGAFLADKIKGVRAGDLFVAVNLSWGQMRSADFAGALRETIARYGLPKNALVLELTEADEVSETDDAASVFKALKDAGAALAFDDFGAGFSSLSNLRKYDFDYLKIDKSFAADLADGGDGAKIVGALAQLGGKLGLNVIVEGVESDIAAKAALKVGCAYGQGYALGEPAQLAAGPGAGAGGKKRGQPEKHAKPRGKAPTGAAAGAARDADPAPDASDAGGNGDAAAASRATLTAVPASCVGGAGASRTGRDDAGPSLRSEKPRSQGAVPAAKAVADPAEQKSGDKKASRWRRLGAGGMR